MQYHGIQLDLERDQLFNEEGKTLLSKYYSDGREGIQKAIARAANCFSYGDQALAQRIYDAASKHWFFYSSPILSNAVEGYWKENCHSNKEWFWKNDDVTKEYRQKCWAGEKPKAMPIACFGSYVPDTIEGQINASSELSLLSVMGGGTALHSRIRAVSDKAPGPIPYAKTIDGIMGYYRQGKTRRGAAAIYMDISHPDIVEFINIRKPSGGDPARKINNRAGVHHAVNITDAFKEAVDADAMWELVCPHTQEVKDRVRARELWEQLLETRELTGEPYLYFIDVANRALPEPQRNAGLRNYGSNLCSEITLPTSDDRTFVCCLSSLNLEKYDEWKDTSLVVDLVRFLDNVLQWFIDNAPDGLHRAVYSATRERALGIGAMGFHNYLMSKGIPFESGGFNSAAQHNHIIFNRIHRQGIVASELLGKERGECPDMEGTGRRNSHVFAIAPNSNSSVLCNTSPSIEPIASNAYTQKTRAGVYLVKNKWLEKLLNELGQNTESVWTSIVRANGSIQHLDFLSDSQKLCFKTAWEIDQNWLVEHAGNRQQFICQAQSLNLFFLPGTDRSYINSVHLKAMREGKIKSLYYFRTGSATKADTVKTIQRVVLNEQSATACLSCEG
ncbi:ribonucleoside-diphosphate reductase subunit alpha [Burkholderia territorii]|uniref:ribonucleoside-diphosphate reductase subunit alpha n=1 Tax=Burkholderia territorii TaxID=1503055 RepID=UPI0009BF6424|nr:ribonucleoside-diphosphate reductase subunit alpha [Burkholderia territorii]